MTYQIKHWNETFENNKSREIKEPKYVAWPVRRDSEGFQHLSRLPNFLQAFGLFALLVQLAARQSPRGVLRDDRGDITPERIAKRYGVPVPEAQAAFDSLTDEDVGWIVPVGADAPAPSVDAPAPSVDAPAPPAHQPARSAALSSNPSPPSPPVGGGPSPPEGGPGETDPLVRRKLELLDEYGVKSPDREVIAHDAKVKPTALRAAWQEVNADKSVRSKVAVLAHRLSGKGKDK
jgi:hypothetical protein